MFNVESMLKCSFNSGHSGVIFTYAESFLNLLLYSLLSLVNLDFVVDQTQAVKFGLDIACGMAFLHTLEPMIPRHYLNSKSVMVSNGKQTFPTYLGFYNCGVFPCVYSCLFF